MLMSRPLWEAQLDEAADRLRKETHEAFDALLATYDAQPAWNWRNTPLTPCTTSIGTHPSGLMDARTFNAFIRRTDRFHWLNQPMESP